jgi:hypothetical protein
MFFFFFGMFTLHQAVPVNLAGNDVAHGHLQSLRIACRVFYTSSHQFRKNYVGSAATAYQNEYTPDSASYAAVIACMLLTTRKVLVFIDTNNDHARLHSHMGTGYNRAQQ